MAQTKCHPQSPKRPVLVKWAGTMIATLSLVAVIGVASPAAAGGYPSWSDVESARSSEASKQMQIMAIKDLIAGLVTEVATARDLAARRGAEYERAQGAFDEATYRATTLQSQADDATQRASVSQRQAGRLAATLARAGASDLSMTIFLQGENSDALLYQLGAMSKLTERSSTIYEHAATDRNSATVLTDQAKVAKEALGALAREAETTLKDATTASAALMSKLAEQEQNAGTLQAQLAVLSDNRAATEADYAKGEEARRAAEAAAAASAAAAAAAAAGAGGAAASSGGGGGSALDVGQLSEQGWALPVSGWISDSFGPRPSKPVAGVGAFHYGTDIAAGCGRAVSAATGGTVIFAGYLGSYGNWVLIDHGNGVQTGYAHNSQILVSNGQQVAAGETISLVGTTGASSGCHLHFETRVDGARINPVPFMSARGITLG
ncbi:MULTISPECIES: M23 family metallopeptidase [Cryobacterium]|nr:MULTISPECIES: M23 family metallopeptidase [Cryobacterium]TFD15377.1 cell wall-binding protein [Cryobacterium sp. TMT4-10]TFD21020.1 cell wall-binding protein [Cryobacterium sp. TMT2-23]